MLTEREKAYGVFGMKMDNQNKRVIMLTEREKAYGVFGLKMA